MPIYVYKNLKTGETFEVSQRITEAALTEHPETGDPVKRVVQPVGIAFKGAGFYVNDSRAGSTEPSKTAKPAKGASAGASSD
ncbi:MAG: FmdB family transcriptional regulator [Deinococcales bacterium]